MTPHNWADRGVADSDDGGRRLWICLNCHWRVWTGRKESEPDGNLLDTTFLRSNGESCDDKMVYQVMQT